VSSVSYLSFESKTLIICIDVTLVHCEFWKDLSILLKIIAKKTH